MSAPSHGERALIVLRGPPATRGNTRVDGHIAELPGRPDGLDDVKLASRRSVCRSQVTTIASLFNHADTLPMQESGVRHGSDIAS